MQNEIRRNVKITFRVTEDEMNVITKIGMVSNISFDGEANQLSFTLRYGDGDVSGGDKTVEVQCTEKLAIEIKEHLTDGEQITVIGKDNETHFFIDEEKVIKGIVIITDDNTVYPQDFPPRLAFKYRDEERKLRKILQVAKELADPDDPF